MYELNIINMYVLNTFLVTILYMFSISLGVYISGYTCKRLTHEEIIEEEEKERQMIQYMELLNFPHLYEDELKDLSLNPTLTPEQLKGVIIEMDVPMNKVIMYYDNNSFCYYTKHGDVGYKYLNVVCRKYVIDNHCKELYKEGPKPMEEVKELKVDNCFTKIKPKPARESKQINKFIHMGTFDDYYESKKVVPKCILSFNDYFSSK